MRTCVLPSVCAHVRVKTFLHQSQTFFVETEHPALSLSLADNGGHEVGQGRRQREGTALSDARSPAANRQRPDAYQHGQQAAPAPMNPWSAAQWGQAAMATAMPGNGQYGQMLQALGQPAGQYSAPPSTYGDATSTYSAVCAAISVYEHQIVRQDFRLVWSMLA